MCLGSIRTYAYYNPFVDPKTDVIAEIALWSLFFVMFGALLIKVNMDNESLQNRGYFDAILVVVNLTPILLPVIQQVAIVKNLKRVEVLSTAISQVGAFFGVGGDVVAAKKQMDALEKNFGILGALKKKRGENDEERGLGGGELVGNPMQAESVLGGEIGDIEMKSVNKKHLIQASSFNDQERLKGKGLTGPLRKNTKEKTKKYEDNSDHEDEEIDVKPPPISKTEEETTSNKWEKIWDENHEA